MSLYDDPRSSWTDYRPTGRVAVAPGSRVGIRWHWSGNPTRLAGKAHSACLSLVAAWERYHRDTRGWNSIGYNLLVCPHERVIEGRGVDYRGAHSGSSSDNAATYGVQLMVGEGELATPGMFARAAQLERALWDHSGRRLTSSGHKDAPGASTACPGPQIYAWAHSPHTVATPTPTPTQEDPDVELSDLVTITPYVRRVTGTTDEERAVANVLQYGMAGFYIGQQLQAQVAALAGTVAGLATAVQQLAAGDDLDMAAITAAADAGARAGVAAALAEGIDLDVEVRAGS